MKRLLVLGATGAVGRTLLAHLAREPDVEVFAVGRNRVLLDHLAGTFGARAVQLDLGSADASMLPEADVVLDLAYELDKHPRAVVRRAERLVSLVGDYLDLHPAAQAVHTGTFALLNERPALAEELASNLVWSGTYLLSKSAAERAIRRLGSDRLRVIRLGNMAVPDMVWTDCVMRAASTGAAGRPALLARPANLAGAGRLARAVFETRPELSYLDDVAGFTWGEVINAVARSNGQPELDVPAPAAEPALPRPTPGAVLRRGLYVAPLFTAERPLESLPGSSHWLPAARSIMRSPPPPRTAFPVALPDDRTMPTARRDKTELRTLIDELNETFAVRGWAPLL